MQVSQEVASTVPAGVNELRVRQHLLEAHGIEIGGGLGPLKGQIWRIDQSR